MIKIQHRYTGATIYSADVATLREALERAIDTRANLADANLADANLADAYLADADLAGAYLAGANLARAINIPTGLDPMRAVREDICEILSRAPDEVPGLLAALRDGRVDGSAYTGECACLVGTIANLRGVEVGEIAGIKPDATRPAERWFMRISRGDTPLTNASSAYAAAVIEHWLREHEGSTG